MEMIKPILLLFMIISILNLHQYIHNALQIKFYSSDEKKTDELMSCKIL